MAACRVNKYPEREASGGEVMQRILLKSKIHRACVSDVCVDYEGSLTIDQTLMTLADIVAYEQVRVYNVTNGERFETYAIAGQQRTGVICLNGAAAHKGRPGDLIIIATYAVVDDKELAAYQARIVHVDEANRPQFDSLANEKHVQAKGSYSPHTTRRP
jgi:aspartate 1-decarboxylase